jgi:hypothetical protein
LLDIKHPLSDPEAACASNGLALARRNGFIFAKNLHSRHRAETASPLSFEKMGRIEAPGWLWE